MESTSLIECVTCEKLISKTNISKHRARCNETASRINRSLPSKPCARCGKMISITHLSKHLKICKPSTGQASKRKIDNSETEASTSKQIKLSNERKPIRSAFNDQLQDFSIKSEPGRDILSFLDETKTSVLNILKDKLENNSIKVYVVLFSEYEKVDGTTSIFYHRTKNQTLHLADVENLDNFYYKVTNELVKKHDDFEAKGSGWSLCGSPHTLTVYVNRFSPLRASSYVPLPPNIQHKRAVLNIQNSDNKCFLWCILAALHPVHWSNHPEQVSNYKQYETDFQSVMSDIEYPVTLSDITKFENRAGKRIAINVYSFTSDKYLVHPVRISDIDDDDARVINLLLISNEDVHHYTLIRSISRLLGSQTTKHEHCIEVCPRCLTTFDDRDRRDHQNLHSRQIAIEKLAEHKIYCGDNRPARMLMPETNEVEEFKMHKALLEHPAIIVADFESFLKPLSYCEPDPEISSTTPYQLHQPNSFGYVVVRRDKINEAYIYRGPNVIEHFLEKMVEEVEVIGSVLLTSKPMAPLTENELQNYNSTEVCPVCDQSFTDENKKIFHHDHFSGNYIGGICNTCNLKIQKPKFIPIFFHNGSGYDFHHLVRHLGYDPKRIGVLAENEERYISLSKQVSIPGTKNTIEMRFLDSYRFLSASLDALANKLTDDQFKITRASFPNVDIELVRRKGVYPYEYVSDGSKFNDDALPLPREFYSRLREKGITDEEYQHAQLMWEKLECRTLGDYHDAYLKLDVTILADVFQAFRKTATNIYKLDPAYFYSLPGLAWSAMLFQTKVKLELISDVDMLLFIERGIRGGMVQCVQRHAKANNVHMKEDYDSNRASNYIFYADVNNLYGHAMVQKLPYGGFEWLDPTSIDIIHFDDSECGFFAEVDLQFSDHLHDTFSDLPPTPEIKCPPDSVQDKLLLTLDPKQRYVVHYKNLRFLIGKGVQIVNVRRILKFKHSTWLRPYIETNTQHRTAATSDLDKDFFKLMNNAVYGKTMENVRKHVDVKLISDKNKCRKWIADPRFKSRKIYNENLALFNLDIKLMKFRKPIYVGATVLDLSKLYMFEFHYDVMKPFYNDKISLLYTDTDSFIYSIQTPNLYEDIKNSSMHEYFDTSAYPQPNRFGIPSRNKKVLGKLKDECNGDIIVEFAGLRSKMYAMRTESSVTKKAKGVGKNTVENKLTFHDYIDCLYSQSTILSIEQRIQSVDHVITTNKVRKVALDPHDDKRCILSCGIHTLPWGHYRLENSKNCRQCN